MSVVFKNILIKNAVSRSLFKSKEEEIFEEELPEIESLSIDFLNDFSNDSTLDDLLLLNNLKELSLKDFLIEDDTIKVINNLEHLEELYLEFCPFNDPREVFCNDSLRILTINTCDGFNVELLKNNKIETLFIKDSDNQKLVFDIMKLGTLDRLESLSVNNYYIKNITLLNDNAPLLNELNIDGSVVYDEEIKALNSTIDVSHEEEYLPIIKGMEA